MMAIGERRNRLVLVAIGPVVRGRKTADFVCDCGVRKAVTIEQVKYGKTKSCGCLNRERWAAEITRHGHAPRGDVRPEYNAWNTMVMRCHNPNVSNYPGYGGRGITVCARWREYHAFIADMGPRPPRTSLDRRDNDGGYWCGKCEECVGLGRPANCRWATGSVQGNNRGNNHRLTVGGITQTITEWGRATGLKPSVIRDRVSRYGWDPATAVSRPSRSKRQAGLSGIKADWLTKGA